MCACAFSTRYREQTTAACLFSCSFTFSEIIKRSTNTQKWTRQHICVGLFAVPSFFFISIIIIMIIITPSTVYTLQRACYALHVAHEKCKYKRSVLLVVCFCIPADVYNCNLRMMQSLSSLEWRDAITCTFLLQYVGIWTVRETAMLFLGLRLLFKMPPTTRCGTVKHKNVIINASTRVALSHDNIENIHRTNAQYISYVTHRHVPFPSHIYMLYY